MPEHGSTHEISREQESNFTLERDENGNAYIEKPEGKYVILYTAHHEQVELNELLPEETDGFFMETGPHDYTADPVEVFRCVPDRGYLEENNISVYLGDTNLNLSAIITDKAVVVGESILAGSMIGSEISSEIKRHKDKKKEKEIDRRSFLRIGAKGLAGAYLSMPLISTAGRIFSGFTGYGSSTTAEFKKLSQKLHPEEHIFLYTLRNVVMAHKQQHMMENMNDSQMATLIGAAHTGIEDQIKHSPEERLEFLKALKKAGILKKVIKDPETFYKVLQYDYDEEEGQWSYQETEIPELKELLEDSE